jgi:hypothetical protein
MIAGIAIFCIIVNFSPRHRLIPLDGELNLPVEQYSHGLRQRVAVEVARSGFRETVAIIEKTTAAFAFYSDTSKQAEIWVSKRLQLILEGKSSSVAALLRRSATLRQLTTEERKPVDNCARYLLNNANYLKYDDYLKAGLPIATGVIEGACRHLIKDRMDITGARWSLAGAEAVLRLRSLYKAR